MKKVLVSLILVHLLFPAATSQFVQFPVTNYSMKDYGKDFHPQNTAVIQDNRGMIYASNSFKLLEFDGAAWRSYPINKEVWILSLACGNNGLIYAGAQNEFGYFMPDRKGELKYHSLSDSLKKEDRDFSNVWKVINFNGSVVFQSEENLFITRGGKISVIRPETSFHTSFRVNDRLFIREREKGLMELRGEKLFAVPGGERFDTTGIFLMLPFGNTLDKILVGTREKGFWVMDAGSAKDPFSRFRLEDEEIINKSEITGGTLTADGSIAIGTLNSGVIIIDPAGKTKAVIDSRKGLPDNEIKDIFTDSYGDIWVALNNGISRIGITSPLSVYSEKSGISGIINCALRFRNLLYLGTTSGLIVQDTDPDNPPFRKLSQISSPVWSLANAAGSLIAATDGGLMSINNENVRIIDYESSYVIFYDPGLKLLFSGGRNGLRVFRSDGSFKKVESLSIRGEDIFGISRSDNPASGIVEFWLGTRYNGVIRVRIDRDLKMETESFTVQDGLPDGPVTPSFIKSDMVFATRRGLFSFVDENTVKESVPDSLKNKGNFIKGYFSPVTGKLRMIGGEVSFVAEDGCRIWTCTANNIGYFHGNDSLEYFDKPFRAVESGKISFIYPEPDGICWIGTTEGLLRYDGNIKKNYDHGFVTLIRKVGLINTDSALFLGTGCRLSPDTLVTGMPAVSPVIKFADNSVRFDFSAPFYDYPAKLQYSFILEGASSRWSSWSSDRYQEFTNLKEGKYTFRVKAKNVYGTEGKPALFTFEVLAPWYRTIWAYILYVFAGIVLLWVSARLYSYRLKKENIRLEGIVTERTAQVVRQKDEIEQKNTILEHQKKEIEDSIRYARRIQSAVIPSEKVCQEILPESFVLFRPLNIVSGDFYWISRVDGRIIYTAADCTGHGVPGAFMSMLGVAFLNEIVNKDKCTAPDEILNQLREKVINALQQHGASGETRDGMDIALVSIITGNGTLEFAGAFNPLILIRKGEIIETPGEKMPIGIYENMRPFSKHVIKIEKGDAIYMYSDGYEDQFGGPDGKKFKARKLKSLLLEISMQPPEKQKEILETTFDNWKGDLPQIDDIVLLGIMIK